MITNARTNQVVLARVEYRTGFFSRFIGLQFGRKLEERAGAVFVCKSQSRLGSAIHTIGMRFCIGVLWLDKERRVVDMRLAKPGRLAYLPDSPAMYYVEADPSILSRVKIGDQLIFDEVWLEQS